MQTKDQPTRVMMLQDGARLHYAVPLSLERLGLLERVFTDWYSGEGTIWRQVAAGVQLVKQELGTRMLGRVCTGLPNQKVFSHRRMVLNRSGHDVHCLWYGRELGAYAKRKGPGRANAVLGFVRMMDPEFLEWCKSRGMVLVGDQMIAPAAEELEEDQRQRARWPEFAGVSKEGELRLVSEAERKTWDLLDHITCGSEYVASGLARQGVDLRRVNVMPYPIDSTKHPYMERSGREGPVTIGFVGSVSLRKGLPYFLEVAKRMRKCKGVRFVMVGGVSANRQTLESQRGKVEVVGAVPRQEVPTWLKKFDIFYFPSTCEGCAGSVMESMSTGLPIVASFNAGTPVRDGQEGFIRSFDDIDGTVEVLERLAGDEGLRVQLGRNARLRVQEYSLESYGRMLKANLDACTERRRTV